MPGPFTTARQVYTSFSSKSRPPVVSVQKSMEELEKSGLGIFKTVNKLKIFYKKSPVLVEMQAKLANFGISFDEYSANFKKKNSRLTSRNMEVIVEAHPIAEIRAELESGDLN